MVQFARIDGVVTIVEYTNHEGSSVASKVQLTVTLDNGVTTRIVRTETLTPLRPIETDADLSWHADQWTQETIGVDLAGEGWEAFALGEASDSHAAGIGQSPTYIVRRL